jgi:hypothetical protein
MLGAIGFLASLALLAAVLGPHWSWMNVLRGAIITHILVGQWYLSKAINTCCLRTHPSRSSCLRACATLAAIELSGAIFFGVFGTHSVVMLRQLFFS